MKTIELTFEQIDSIVIEELKDSYRMNAKHQKIDCSDDYLDPDAELLRALDTVLDYYLSADEKIKWNLEKKDMANVA